VIFIDRGSAPPILASIRKEELRRVRAQRSRGEPMTFKRYGHKDVRDALYRAQGFQCCYCEFLIQKKGSPIEHFRPKQRAERGHGRSTHGYWWLAWDWENLFLACVACNLTKGTKFPLSRRGGALRQGSKPPGAERPLFIDPALEDPTRKIRFMFIAGHWRPIPRNGDQRARVSLRGIGLDAPDFLDNYDRYVKEHIDPLIDDVERKIQNGQMRPAKRAWINMKRRLFGKTAPYKGLAYDVLDQRFPKARRARFHFTLPRP